MQVVEPVCLEAELVHALPLLAVGHGVPLFQQPVELVSDLLEARFECGGHLSRENADGVNEATLALKKNKNSHWQ